MLGKKFNKLTAIAVSNDKLEGNCKTYLFTCDCGREKVMVGHRVKSGRLKSCGCIRGEPFEGVPVRGTAHYQAWSDMKQRCYNPKTWAYTYYGARGITVCDEWRNSYRAFARDMGNRPDKMSLDRIDNDKGYYKDNCKWSTKKEQINNRRDSSTWRVA